VTLLGFVLSVVLAVFSTASLVFSLRAGRHQRHLDEYKETVL
jgi:hypothetical protein